MKKILIVFACFLALTGCKAPEKTPEEQALQIANNEYVLLEIEELQAQLERGEITEKYASERLKQILKERQRLNSGSTEVILEKIKEQPKIFL